MSNLNRLILICSLILLTVLFFFGGPGYYSPRSFQAAWNIGHIIYFALLALVVLSRPSKNPRGPVIKILIILGLTLVIGVLVELIQADFQRSPDMGDLFRNLIGALCGIAFSRATLRPFPARVRHGFQMTIGDRRIILDIICPTEL